MKLRIHTIIACCIMGVSALRAQDISDPVIYISFQDKGPEIPASMYGIFFEEINHSGDGGLYAELIQNRGFEDNNLPSGTILENGRAVAPKTPNYRSNRLSNFSIPWDTVNRWPGWTLKQQGSAKAKLILSMLKPLNNATPHSMQIDILQAGLTESAGISNEGFWGIAVKKDEKYNLRFYMRTDSYNGPVEAKLLSASGDILAQYSFKQKQKGNWNEYTTVLVPRESDAKASFELSFTGKGTVWVDYVSLFPEKTFMSRKNGMRPDVAQLLAGLKPAFMRWPGGCIVEGLTLENRVKWKETLGDPVTRPGEYDLWGYRNSYGFGYHEFLQFSEDIGADGMFVANIGVSCSVRNGDYCAPEEVNDYIQDALDAVEYAIGDVNTQWGSKRAAAGHPDPFPLKYVEIGNEDAGPEIYNERYNLFYKALKTKYPEIILISNHGLNDNLATVPKLDMIDPHYYVSPDRFYNMSNSLFDNKKPRPDHTAYVGEYAVNRNVGAGNLNAALSEAAFLIGMERNSDYVTMTSYAPLIENSNKRDWPVNLIWVNSDQSLGRSSYYVQKLFAENRPDMNLKTRINIPDALLIKEPFKGFLGLSTNNATAEISEFSYSGQGNQANLLENNWIPVDGQWQNNSGSYVQSDSTGVHFSYLKNVSYGNGTYEFKFQKNGSSGDPNTPNFRRMGNGFSFLFGVTDDKNYYQLTFGGRSINLNRIVDGNQQFVRDPELVSLNDNQSYAVKIVINNDQLECLVEGKSIFQYKFVPDIRHYAIAGYSKSENEVVVKVVNAEAEAFATGIDLGDLKVSPAGEVIVLSSASLTDENSFEQPEKITPVIENFNGFSNKFSYNFKPFSLTILKLKIAK